MPRKIVFNSDLALDEDCGKKRSKMVLPNKISMMAIPTAALNRYNLALAIWMASNVNNG
jgi:hypothetical protein